jgi:hypothetical protein
VGDDFEFQTSYRFVIRKRLEVVWRVLGLEDPVELPMPCGVAHRITLNFGGGQHDCILEGTVDGQVVSWHQERRVVEPHTVTVLTYMQGEEHLLTMSMSGWLWWTRIVVTLELRMTTGTRPNEAATLAFQHQSWKALRTFGLGAKASLRQGNRSS